MSAEGRSGTPLTRGSTRQSCWVRNIWDIPALDLEEVTLLPPREPTWGSWGRKGSGDDLGQ